MATAEGPRPISSSRVGDLVLAFDERTGLVGYFAVTDVVSHEDEHVLKLTMDGEVLTTTPEHPFYVETVGWVRAEALSAGMRVRKADGGFGVVHALALERSPQRMYNLALDGARVPTRST